MQMFPELISSHLRRLKLANVNISQRGPTRGSAHSAFPSLAVISDSNDEQIFLKNVLFPISSSTLYFFPRLCSDWLLLQGGWNAGGADEGCPYDPLPGRSGSR